MRRPAEARFRSPFPPLAGERAGERGPPGACAGTSRNAPRSAPTPRQTARRPEVPPASPIHCRLGPDRQPLRSGREHMEIGGVRPLCPIPVPAASLPPSSADAPACTRRPVLRRARRSRRVDRPAAGAFRRRARRRARGGCRARQRGAAHRRYAGRGRLERRHRRDRVHAAGARRGAARIGAHRGAGAVRRRGAVRGRSTARLGAGEHAAGAARHVDGGVGLADGDPGQLPRPPHRLRSGAEPVGGAARPDARRRRRGRFVGPRLAGADQHRFSRLVGGDAHSLQPASLQRGAQPDVGNPGGAPDRPQERVRGAGVHPAIAARRHPALRAPDGAERRPHGQAPGDPALHRAQGRARGTRRQPLPRRPRVRAVAGGGPEVPADQRPDPGCHAEPRLRPGGGRPGRGEPERRRDAVPGAAAVLRGRLRHLRLRLRRRKPRLLLAARRTGAADAGAVSAGRRARGGPHPGRGQDLRPHAERLVHRRARRGDPARGGALPVAECGGRFHPRHADRGAADQLLRFARAARHARGSDGGGGHADGGEPRPGRRRAAGPAAPLRVQRRAGLQPPVGRSRLAADGLRGGQPRAGRPPGRRPHAAGAALPLLRAAGPGRGAL
ncbi:MAG: hypothetical protein AVDCRST_MAG89-583 [uncultured Gemmatimonadetes bacterium]|uniref:Uncharacterized protein n=1 Tax=uncultured Gemmatimonadota bacterium TaxID=203437 RepID=A0A6J4KDC0_9BACT|nr:MAG: hypothetical protein AVDCRST_MAG89-583 [uncultured Gemmatimonadota bacterium]